MRKSIAIDMDHVLADIEQQMIKWYSDKYGVQVEAETLKGKPEQEAFPDREKLRDLLFMPGFFRTAAVIEGGIEAVKQLSEDFEVYIVSAAMEFPQSLAEKKEWLTEHFPFISWKNIVFCGDKGIIDTDFMIDDHMKNLNHCKGRGILFTANHNANIDYDVRVNNWKEACDYLYQNR
ncbi:5'(3')-deoxyribonucleotidase [Fulvivirga maritima]|uniref:5' nucleotidase, NT5C type n=1 Tax=Fulvivirga maritima TaxID=2904247 RepID=UPI001F403D75|nr:5'(3')-deoxyribonucleotidase [Fulvivirga maritima]UII25464.1 5'(3')-deoxyribonucleotidase [Fulvivirga maritima]